MTRTIAGTRRGALLCCPPLEICDMPCEQMICAAWWVNDLGPISGELRVVFYAGLLVLCFLDYPSPLHSVTVINQMERAFYTPVGILKLFKITWVEPSLLRTITVLTIVAWLAAVAGLLQPLSAIATFLGFAFLHAVNAGALGTNHSTHGALYALFAMCFSVSNRFSLDQYLASYIDNWPVVSVSAAFQSGFAAKLTLVFLAYCMFAAGIAKLRHGGLAWLNGRSLRLYIKESVHEAGWPAFGRFLVRHPGLCRWLACLTVVVELCSIVALWDTPFRLPLVIAWICLHIGIRLAMAPAYWVQIWCYLLVVDWQGTGVSPAVATSRAAVSGIELFAGIGWLVSAGLIWVILRQLERWPFTTVPMYSNALPDTFAPPSVSEMPDRARRFRRGDLTAWKRAWVASEVWEDIRIVASGRPLSLYYVMCMGESAKIVRWTQFALVVRDVALADLVAKRPGRVVFDATDAEYPGTLFLRKLAPAIKPLLPQWEEFQGLELVCRADTGWIVTGRASL